jgi:hypothetical protein
MAMIEFLKDPFKIVNEQGKLIVECDLSAKEERPAGGQQP